MKIKVNPHEIEFTQDTEINAGEYNITTLEFEFSEEYEGLTNMAIFSTCENSYKAPIFDNQCIIPYEVLEETGNVLLGVYGYEGDEELTLRYSPTPKYFHVVKGSYREAGDPELPPKSEWEQVVEEVNEAIDEANNLNIEAEKVEGTTTITITHKDGQEQTFEILDGEKGDKGDKGDPGAIKMQIVNELPTTGSDDTIYLVPIPGETGNNYEEYIYVNGGWEKIGGIQVEVDLSDYYTKEETDALIPDLTDYVKNTDYATSIKAGVLKSSEDNGLKVSVNGWPLSSIFNYGTYQNKGNDVFISKGTLENVITGKNLETANNKVTTIDENSTDTQYPSAKCMYDIVGDVESLLEILDIGTGAQGGFE